MIVFASLRRSVQSLHTILAVVLCILLAATVLAALGFEHIGGLMPCKLCLKERIPYYIGTPLMLAAAGLSMTGRLGAVIRLLFFIVFLLMAWNFALSVYHTGVEWRWWNGPIDCSAAMSALPHNAGNLLERLGTSRPVRCDEAALSFLGLSLAGWNAVASLGYAAIAFFAAFAACRQGQN